MSDPIPVIQENVVDLWESIPTNWPRLKYEEELVKDLSERFRKYERRTGVKIRRILDCGCGTGNPSIGLAKEGFEVIAVDKDPRMVERFKQNCADAGVEIYVRELDWRNLAMLSQNGKGLFDVVMCRGNGLIYIESWDKTEFSIQAARVAIETSLRDMVGVLNPGGILYVDMASEREMQNPECHLEVVGRRDADEVTFVTYWLPHYDPDLRIRRLEVTRVEHSKPTLAPIHIRRYSFVGYLMKQDELQDLMRTAGCEKVEKMNIQGEHLYDSFWGYKRLRNEW